MDVYRILLWLLEVLLAFICPLVSSLQCYYCNDSSDDETCSASKQLRHCPEDMDSCSLQAMWYGDLYGEMQIVRSCMDSSLCPGEPVDSTNNSSCVKTHQGLSCTMCCREDGCNNGFNEPGFPRPPPKPPTPQTLVARLVTPCEDIGSKCEHTRTWTDYDTRLHVRTECEKKSEHSRSDDFVEEFITGKELECNIQKDDTFCVTCCAGEDCNAAPSMCPRPSVVIGSLLVSIVVYLVRS